MSVRYSDYVEIEYIVQDREFALKVDGDYVARIPGNDRMTAADAALQFADYAWMRMLDHPFVMKFLFK